MSTDRIPASTLWSSHTGPIVGGVAPTAYSITSVPGKRPSWLMQTSGNSAPGGQYPAVEFYPAASSMPSSTALGRKISPHTGHLQFCIDQWVDERAAYAANVYETDTILIADGYKYNLSGQRHNASGEIDDGNWTDTGLRLGILTPNVKHRIKWTYTFDLAKKLCSVLSYECDGAIWPIAAKFQNMPATPSNWTPGVYSQFQLGSLAAGLPWAMRVGNIRYKWR